MKQNMASKSPHKRQGNKVVEIPIWAEIFLMRLFGQPMAHIHSKRSTKTWKKILVRLASSIEKAIKINVGSDGLHILRLGKFTEQLKKACKKKDINQPDIILPLVGIIFELLGGTPNYSHRPRINRKSDYTLFDLRALEFKQTTYQKMRTILEASRQTPFYDYHNYDDLSDVYVRQFNSNPEEFIKWYKKEYPQVYLRLF